MNQVLRRHYVTIYASGENPGIALYKFWDATLDGSGRERSNTKALPFERNGWGIAYDGSEDGRVIHYGQLSGQHLGAHHFSLTSTGEFKLGPMWGQYRRDAIVCATFLRWGWLRGRYQWYIDTEPVDRSRPYYYWHARDLLDHHNPTLYLSEDVLGCRDWRQDPAWMRAERTERGWEMVPVKESDRRYWKHYLKIRERRYRSSLNRERATLGLPPVRASRRPATLRSGTQALTPDEAVTALVAAFTVTTPAKTTPMNKEAHKEALHAHDVAPTH